MKSGTPRKRAATKRTTARSAAGAQRRRLAPGMDETPAHSIALQADCTVRHAVALRTFLLAQLDEAEEVHLDGSAVDRIDTVCLQLLAAFVRERGQSGRSVAWRGQSDSLRQAAGLLGLTAILRIDGRR